MRSATALATILLLSSTVLQAKTPLSSIFGAHYATAYDGSDLIINGPPINTDDALLHILKQPSNDTPLIISGALETVFSDEIKPQHQIDQEISRMEVDSLLNVNHVIHAYLDSSYDPAKNQLSFPNEMITLADLNRSPLYLTAGRYDVAFGSYGSSVIHAVEPIPVILGEVHAPALSMGLDHPHINISSYLYRSNVVMRHGNDIAGGINLALKRQIKQLHTAVGLSFISNLADDDAMHLLYNKNNPLSQAIAGIDVRAKGAIDHNTLSVEYTAAMTKASLQDMRVGNHRVRPSVIHAEVAHDLKLANRPLHLAVGISHTYDAMALAMPQQRIYGMISYSPLKRTVISLQLDNDRNYGPNQHVYVGTMRQASEDGKSHLGFMVQGDIYF